MNTAPSLYPENDAQRDRWIIERRGARAALDPYKPYGFLLEEEHFAAGDIGTIATLFLTNRECPWHCAMCDLWRNTLTESVPAGAIAAQISHALSQLPAARQVKLYNSGSFFDQRAIPPDEYTSIARLLTHFERVIVESHPALIENRCFDFAKQLNAQLEVAMGLETAHPQVLQKLNKRMTLEQYARSADKLSTGGIALRSFILLQPPFMAQHESLHWACRSIDFALTCGATAITLIPTRAGNGAMDQLIHEGRFLTPTLSLVEDALDYGISLHRARIFIDLWDISQVQSTPCCRNARIERLRLMNLSQHLSARIECSQCEGQE